MVKSNTDTNMSKPSTYMSTKRIIWIDIVKGCLLVFICCSHFGALPQSIALLTKPTATYWVPLFFFLSGYLFHGNNNFSEYIQKKVRTLLLPYIAFSLIFIILTGILTYLPYHKLKQTYIVYLSQEQDRKKPHHYGSLLFCTLHPYSLSPS